MTVYVNTQDGTVVEGWDDDARIYTDFRTNTTRPYTAQENAIADARITATVAGSNEQAIVEKAQQALTTNGVYLALASPTAAQNAAQVKALTRQMNAIIRLVTRSLNETAGT